MTNMDARLLDAIISTVGVISAVICLFEGIRRFRMHGYSRGAAASVAIGLIYFALYAGYSYWGTKVQNEVVASLSKGLRIPEIDENWGKDFPQQQRFEKSYLLAKVAYNDHGELRYYLDQLGKKVLFAPSQFEIREREKVVADRAKLRYLAEQTSDGTLRWILFALVTALFGFLSGGRKSSNLPLDPDDPSERRST